MNAYPKPRTEERGIALVVAMLVLLVMTLLAIVLMAGVAMNRNVSGHDLRARQALNVAEAGVGEAIARIRSTDASLNTARPHSVAVIYNVASGSVPVLGVDSTGLATAQPAGSWLNYTTASRSPDQLTISFKLDPTGTQIMKYDPTLNPAINTASGLPIYEIKATGRQGTARKTVVADVIQKPFPVNCKAALTANVPIGSLGNAVICGWNHSSSTQPGDGSSGRGVLPGDATHCIDNELPTGQLAGAWSTGAISPGGAANVEGSPQMAAGQTGFYAGPWEALGMSQNEFFSWVGTGSNSYPDLNGIRYYDNDGIAQNQSDNGIAFHSQTGEGLLYVDGDLTCNAGFTYKGLIYVEKDLKINGQAWVLGGIIVRGTTSVQSTGGMTILYSADTIIQKLAQYGGLFITLSWREQ